ncbi:hypothetical protein ACFQ07_04255, partial [Actinomadura adrarensis]
IADHQRGCTSLQGLGRVKRVTGLGQQACLTAENGWLPVVTLLARKDDVRISIRYATQAKDLATVERDTIETARRIRTRL